MSKTLQVGNKVFNYPSQGTGQGHGEDATGWAEAVTDSLADVQGPNDILLTVQTLANGASNQPIPELTFNVGEVQHVNIEYLILRTFNDGVEQTIVESGKIFGNYTGSDFRISIDSTGDDCGIDIEVNSSGQFSYSSTTLTGHITSRLYYKAKTIDQ